MMFGQLCCAFPCGLDKILWEPSEAWSNRVEVGWCWNDFVGMGFAGAGDRCCLAIRVGGCTCFVNQVFIQWKFLLHLLVKSVGEGCKCLLGELEQL